MKLFFKNIFAILMIKSGIKMLKIEKKKNPLLNKYSKVFINIQIVLKIKLLKITNINKYKMIVH